MMRYAAFGSVSGGDGPGTSSLRLTHVQGDPFIDGCGGWAIVFEGEDQGGDNGGMEQGANINPHVLTTGGPAFTHMTVLQTENYPDGGYYYEDMTQDGSILIINCAYPGGRRNGVSMEEYAVKSIEHLTMYEAENLSAEKNSGYSEALGHPVYILTYTTSENDHTFHWKIFMTGSQFMRDAGTGHGVSSCSALRRYTRITQKKNFTSQYWMRIPCCFKCVSKIQTESTPPVRRFLAVFERKETEKCQSH